jgi:hypothetical protein
VAHGVLLKFWVLLKLVNHLPNIDRTPKYYQNALEVAVGLYTQVVYNPTATFKAF